MGRARRRFYLNQKKLASKRMDTVASSLLLIAAWYPSLSALLLLGELRDEGRHFMVSGALRFPSIPTSPAL